MTQKSYFTCPFYAMSKVVTRNDIYFTNFVSGKTEQASVLEETSCQPAEPFSFLEAG